MALCETNSQGGAMTERRKEQAENQEDRDKTKDRQEKDATTEAVEEEEETGGALRGKDNDRDQ
jgi:hypothetical protein